MHEIKLPQMGQSVEEASIVAWLKQEGDAVNMGDPLFTIQTDKAEIECESTAAGVLRKILVQPDVMVPVLTVVAWVGTADEPLPAGAAAPQPAAAAATQASAPAASGAAQAAVAQAAVAVAPGAQRFVSPRARAKAAELRVNAAAVSGTGAGGRVMETDVLAYAERLDGVRISPVARRVAENTGVDIAGVAGSGPHGRIMKADVLAAASAHPAAATTAPAAPAGGVQRIPLSPMRKIIARRMAESLYTAPHYYITMEIDMAAAKAYRASVTSYKLSLNDLVLKATIDAAREFPGVNARWAGDAIEQLADVNLGIAVALPTGLIVPVLKQAQTLTLEQMTAQARVLIEKARTGKLLPDDFAGNTITVSNLGPYGVDHFTAIINQPDSAILAIGQMKERVVAIDGGIHIRPIMKVTMSSDHRVIDGAVAAQYMAKFKSILESAQF